MDRTPEAMNQNESLPMAFVRNFATLMRDVTDKDRKSAKSLFVHVVAVDGGDHLCWSLRNKGVRLAKHPCWNSAVYYSWLNIVLAGSGQALNPLSLLSVVIQSAYIASLPIVGAPYLLTDFTPSVSLLCYVWVRPVCPHTFTIGAGVPSLFG